jgi:ribonuclease HI
MKKVICYVASATHGNPGPAAVGVAVVDAAGAIIKESRQSIGNARSNFAAYHAVMTGLQTLQSVYGKATQRMQVEICLDNTEVKRQLNAERPITEPGLVPLFIEIHNIRVMHFPTLSFTLVKSAQLHVAHTLAQQELDCR